MKTIVRELRPSDMSSFVDLCETRDNFDRSAAEKRASIVEWMAFHNPCNDGNPRYFVGVQGDKVVGHLGRMPTNFNVRGTVEPASYFHDLYVHPELRKVGAQGFFLSMKLYVQAEKASPSFCAMIWTNQINISLQKARKYRTMWMDRRVMVLGASEKVPPIATNGIRSLCRAGNWVNGLRLPKSDGRVEVLERFDTRFDKLATRSAGHLGIAPHKDQRYLNWKYVDRPEIRASLLQLLGPTGQLEGFCVVILPDTGITASIAELQVYDNDPGGIHSLLGAAIGTLQNSHVDRIEAVASDLAYSQALHERWFRRDLRIPLFMAHSERSPNAQLLRSPMNWHVSLGDSEGPF